MKFWAIVVIILFLLLMSGLYRLAKSTMEVYIVTGILIGVAFFAMWKMPWVFRAFARDFDNESQKCIGWEMEENVCFGIVQSRY